VATEVKGAAQAVSEAVTEAGAAAQEAFSSLAADVKRLLDEGKAAEAAQRIQNAISQLKLTPEQRQRVEELMAQAQDLIKKKGAEAANAVSGFLKKDGK
jgi:Spy/CpxP family protein refolding chaperone